MHDTLGEDAPGKGGELNKPAGRSINSAPIMRMFEKTSPRLIDVGAVRVLFDKFSTQVGTAFSEIAPVQLSTRLDQLDQRLGIELLEEMPRVVTVVGNLAEWNAAAFVRLDQVFLFRLLDAMYGGDPRQSTTIPARPLTAIEGALAVRLAQGIMANLRDALGGLCSFSFHDAQIVDAASATDAVAPGDYILISVSVIETEERVSILMPAAGLELMREKTASREEGKIEPGVDPEWAAGFKKSVMATTVSLAAIVDGPLMTINDVARLQVGSIVELDADALKRVRIESDGRPIFAGALGQGRGAFTVLLEDVVMGLRPKSP